MRTHRTMIMPQGRLLQLPTCLAVIIRVRKECTHIRTRIWTDSGHKKPPLHYPLGSPFLMAEVSNRQWTDPLMPAFVGQGFSTILSERMKI